MGNAAKKFKVSTAKRGDGFTEYNYTAEHDGQTTKFTVVKRWAEDSSTVWDLLDDRGEWVDSGDTKRDLVAWGKEVCKPVDEALRARTAKLNANLDANQGAPYDPSLWA